MTKNRESKILSLILIVFVCLKLINVINWSWLSVLVPLFGLLILQAARRIENKKQ